MVREEITMIFELHVPDRREEEWDIETMLREAANIVKLPESLTEESLLELGRDEMLDKLLAVAEEEYAAREEKLGDETMRGVERMVMLRTIDSLWVEHLTAMDEMRQGIGLRAYGQTDPLVAYKREAHDMWSQLLENIRHQVTHSVYHVELTQAPAPAPAPRVAAGSPAPARAAASVASGAARQPVAAGRTRKTGRNEPCPCGSGKKYKKCHGLAA
jgi:preprotein translocase subunit SecA